MDTEGGEDEEEKEAIRVYARIRPDNEFADEVYISSRFGKQKTIQASMRSAASRRAALLLMRTARAAQVRNLEFALDWVFDGDAAQEEARAPVPRTASARGTLAVSVATGV